MAAYESSTRIACGLLLLLLLLTSSTAAAEPILTSLRHYDAFRLQAKNNVTRKGNVDVVRVVDVDTIYHNHSELAFCHIPALMPLTIVNNDNEENDGTKTTSTSRTTENAYAPFTDIAGIALAVQHFNSGNGTIVTEVEGIDKRCNVRFTYEILDTENSMKQAVNDIIELVSRDSSSSSSSSNNNNGDQGDAVLYQDQDHQNQDLQREQLTPCAFLGEYFSSVSISSSMISGLNEYPQFSPLSTSSTLDNKNQFGLFGRLIPSDNGTAKSLVKYLQTMDINHFAVLHVDDAYGSAYAFSLQEAVAQINADSGTHIIIEAIAIPYEMVLLTPETLRQRIKNVAETKFRFIVGILFANQFEPVMEEAYRQGIVGDRMHSWIFTDGVSNDFFASKRYPKGSPLHLATTGTGLIGVNPGYAPIYGNFSRAIRELDNEEDLEYIASTLPKYNDGGDDWAFPIKEFKLREALNIGAPLLYDTVIAYGLAACDAVAANDKANDNDSKTLNDDMTYFTGPQLYNQMLQTTFEGASGRIVLDPATGTRDATTAIFTITNIIATTVENDDDDDEENFDENTTNTKDNSNENDDGMSVVTFSLTVTNVLQNGEWANIAGESYIFNDGTSNVPPSLPIIKVDENFSSPAMRAFCISMGALVMLASTGFAVWTHLNRNRRVVKASQPIFLHMICAGTFLMGASIIPLSVDDQVATERGCDVACTIYPWLFVNGFVIAFTALLVKTRRINKILNQPNFRRVQVTPFDVIKIMLFFVLCKFTNVAIAVVVIFSLFSLSTEPTDVYFCCSLLSLM